MRPEGSGGVGPSASLPLLGDGSPSPRRGASHPAPRRSERGPTQDPGRLLDAHRPTWAEIDLDALLANLAAIRARIAGRPVLAVVKADAYGHGAVEVARALEARGVEQFGVALPEEGVELRRAGVRAPILLLGGFAPAQADLILAHGLTPAVYRPDQLQALSEAAARRAATVRVHLKVDTGMGRLGVPAADVPGFAERLVGAAGIALEGAFSHLAVADDPDDPFTRRQIERFDSALRALREKGLSPGQVHLANSAAIIDHAPAWLTLVRPGIALYGYPPSERVSPFPLRPVLSLKSRIIYMKEIEAGASLGYGRTWIAARPARIASLALGYDDGLPRPLGNRGHVLVRGRRAPIVGRVSMDLTTVDVSDIAGAALGDEAVVIGRSGGEAIGADEVAARADTIHWVVLCGIGARVPRLYRQGGTEKAVSRFDLAMA
jgi:alanine racemase